MGSKDMKTTSKRASGKILMLCPHNIQSFFPLTTLLPRTKLVELDPTDMTTILPPSLRNNHPRSHPVSETSTCSTNHTTLPKQPFVDLGDTGVDGVVFFDTCVDFDTDGGKERNTVHGAAIQTE